MENFYDVLGCNVADTEAELKAALRREQLLCHPDKCVGLSPEARETQNERFHMLSRAWKVLGNPDNRRRYNAILTQAKLQERGAGRPIQETVSWDDFVASDEQEHPGGDVATIDPEEVYVHPCRCGGEYLLEGVAALSRMNYAYCCQCSLAVKVTYPNKDSDSDVPAE